jgi:hypothetical protein
VGISEGRASQGQDEFNAAVDTNRSRSRQCRPAKGPTFTVGIQMWSTSADLQLDVSQIRFGGRAQGRHAGCDISVRAEDGAHRATLDIWGAQPDMRGVSPGMASPAVAIDEPGAASNPRTYSTDAFPGP